MTEAQTVSIATGWTIDSGSQSFGIGVATTSSIASGASSAPVTTSSTTPISSSQLSPSTSNPTSFPAIASPTTFTSVHSQGGLSAGQTAGVIVGVVVGVCLLTSLAFLLCWRRRKRRRAREHLQARKLSMIGSPIVADRARNTSSISKPPRAFDRVSIGRWSLRPREPSPEEIGVAVTPTERQGFLRRMSSTTSPRNRTVPSISAPILEDRTSIHDSFRDRFFAPPPPPIPDAAEDGSKHVSNSTTIRTSCATSTPSRAPISTTRPSSNATSVAIPANRDSAETAEDIPPVPTFTAVELAMKPVGPKTKNGPRLSLEAGVLNDINKALSVVPSTPQHENTSQEQLDKVSTSSSHSQETSSTRLRLSGASVWFRTPRTNSSSGSIAGHLSPIVQSPRSIYPDIPERSSSRNAMRNSDEERRSEESNGGSSLIHIAKSTRPPVTSTKKSRSVKFGSLARGLSYSRTSVSGAADQPGGSGIDRTSPPKNIERYSNRPLPPTIQPKNVFEDPSDDQHIPIHLDHSARRAMSTPGRDKGHLSSTSSLSSINTAKAVLTPNRTTTGDLVLTVDM